MRIPELLIPAGTLSKLRVALAYGADAVYVGAAGMSMRPDGASLTTNDLATALEECRKLHRRLYVGINSMMFEDDLDVLRSWLDETRDLHFDGVIVADSGVFALVKKIRPELKIHISTQMATANSSALEFWKNAGASRVVLARECSLAQVTEMAEHCDMPLEIFVHGAMCVAISGRCLLSAHLCGHSGSRGECKHSCRWSWQLVEQSRPGESLPIYQTDRETFLFGSTDLCLIEYIPELIKCGASSLKVEGRMKSEYYVATVTAAYRAALDAHAADPENYSLDPRWMHELNGVSHRPYATGFAFGYVREKAAALQAEIDLTSQYQFLGLVEQLNGTQHQVSSKYPFSCGEEVEWIGPGLQTGTVRIASISELSGLDRQRSHCGTAVQVIFENEEVLPLSAILRKPHADG